MVTDRIRGAVEELMSGGIRLYGPGCCIELKHWSRFDDDDRRWSCVLINPAHEEVAAAFRRSPESAICACAEQIRMRADGIEYDF